MSRRNSPAPIVLMTCAAVVVAAGLVLSVPAGDGHSIRDSITGQPRNAEPGASAKQLLQAGPEHVNARQSDTESQIAAVAGAQLADFVRTYCLDCHDQATRTAELDLSRLVTEPIRAHAGTWERVVRKLQARQMPPLEVERPKDPEYEAAIGQLIDQLDASAAEQPNPGRTDTFRRLTRTEYRNAIRDLLLIDVDVSTALPPDQSSDGFDNITVGDLSPTLLNRYVTAAQKISRLALGIPLTAPGGETFRVPADLTQEEHVEGLPIGTRGGTLIPYQFPVDGVYEITVRLARDRNEEVEGLRGTHQLELLLDRRRLRLFEIRPPEDGVSYHAVDAHLHARVSVTAGRHNVGVTFLKQPSSLLEIRRQPYEAHFNRHRHPRIGPAVFQVSINGPYESTGPSDSPSRRHVLFRQPAGPEDAEQCASEVLKRIMRQAYRRPVTEEDLRKPLELFRATSAAEGFDAGIEMALSSVLVNPHFLFRIERDPPDIPSGVPYRLSDLELATRLSFFLWSSLPDHELLHLAEQNQLQRPEVLQRQVRRMLADDRSRALATNFAGQWLYLRNLDSITPDLRLFPDFDDNLRQAFRRETELLFESIMQHDRSVLDLLRPRETFLNERLAKHYGIPHIYGSHFRRVALAEDSRRGGLLRHGSILTVTSYATRTSPVLRGHWILKNILGAPPPPPPANVPDLKDNTVDATLSVRARLAEHRANAACASCHNLMDPVGFALENYDAVGRWRDTEFGEPIDASGSLPDGSQFDDVAGLEQAILERPELFLTTLSEKLMTYAVGRVITESDAPAIRRIVRQCRKEDDRFSALVLSIVQSIPFQQRMSP